MKRVVLILLVMGMITSGCSNHERLTWYETKEEAIEQGVQVEGADLVSILSVEEFEGAMFVIYEKGDALGIASIAESDQGYAWYRSSPYYGFDGDVPMQSIGVVTETYSGEEVSAIAGKVNDSLITSVKASGGAMLDVHHPSGLFYLLHDGHMDLSEVEAMEGES
ncbi:hypothetical protein [Alteribacter aurantiacus]|uniref:hypothetical protein n=1 Tax=Alteribacter aurantiacus TaxID=254410 RepID=UPI00042A0209|nr:hypothetical protein [Alteribacter aurantiacus]